MAARRAGRITVRDTPARTDYTPERLAEQIARLPRRCLAFLPTPLQELPRLSAAIGNVRVVVKRDDQTGLALGGNKTRMLEFTLGRALADGSDCVVAASYADSNHCRQAAAAAARLGLDSFLVLGIHNHEPAPQGNLLLDRLLGARIEFVRARNVSDISGAAAARVEALRAAGRKPFLLTYALDARVLGTIAHAAAFLELTAQLEEADLYPHSIYVASGGNTYAGLLLGAVLTGSAIRVVGIMPEGRRDDACGQVDTLAHRAAARLGMPLHTIPSVELDDTYLGAGYGVPSREGNEALLLAARTEGLLLDPVYTAKGMAGLIGHMRAERIPAGSTVLFVHTGGTPAIFEWAAQLGALEATGERHPA